jgi:hypothetical protein
MEAHSGGGEICGRAGQPDRFFGDNKGENEWLGLADQTKGEWKNSAISGSA